jgi:integrase
LLTQRQAEVLLAAPDPATNQGKRDRAILATLVGCGLRRDEAVRQTFEHIQQRDGRWCVVDLVGKKGRYRDRSYAGLDEDANRHLGGPRPVSPPGFVFRGVQQGRCGDRRAAEHAGDSARRHALCRRDRAHDLRRTFAKLAFKGGAKLDQIQLSLGHASIQTTERYLGVQQDLTDAPCDYLHLKLE